MTTGTSGETGSAWKNWAVAMFCLAAILAFLFRDSFVSSKVLFSNDAPLGLISSDAAKDASTFEGIVTGFWYDLSWIGIELPSVLPGLSWAEFQIFGSPVINGKLYVPVSLMYLGFCAWFLFRTLGFRQAVCVIGALAAALNMETLSHATWGLPSRALTWGSVLLAIAALYSGAAHGRPWIKAALAGMAVGLGIMEGFDVGALYSLYVAAFGLFLAIAIAPAAQAKPPLGKLLAIGGARVAVVAIAAGLFAAQGLTVLYSTQLKDVDTAREENETPEQLWNGATGWSLPKAETFRVIIPGLFGYRMDSSNGGAYWGSVGFPAAGLRHSGAGEYAGVLVVLVAIWGAANAFRKKGNLYTDTERRIVKFWMFAALISILFAWGRWAPFYKLIYPLPFFKTIRNPIKFMHFFHLSLLILFGYGLQLLFRNYIEKATAGASGVKEQFKSWWAKAAPFERKMVLALAAGLGFSLLGFLIYTSSRVQLESYLATVGFPEPANKEIVAFSYGEVGKYLLFYALSLAAILACLSGGLRPRAAALVLGALVVVDLGRANLPWIKYVDYKQKYSPMGLVEILKKDPLEHRVTSKLGPFSGVYFISQESQQMLPAVFGDLLQTQFQYNNVQSLDIIQFPRVPALDAAYSRAFLVTNQMTIPRAPRLWELSNTRYILAQPVDLLKLVDAGKNRFHVITNFNYAVKPGLPADAQPTLDDISWEPSTNGVFSLFEFTGALPRYKLYSAWTQSTNGSATLDTLRSPNFDPQTQLLVNDDSVATVMTGATNAGAAQLVSYAPKKIELKVEATGNAILLWNDRWSPNWHAWVDGQPVKLLRCNYIMRGIQVNAGKHEIVMKYAQPTKALYVTLGTLALGMAFLGFLAFEGRNKQ